MCCAAPTVARSRCFWSGSKEAGRRTRRHPLCSPERNLARNASAVAHPDSFQAAPSHIPSPRDESSVMCAEQVLAGWPRRFGIVLSRHKYIEIIGVHSGEVSRFQLVVYLQHSMILRRLTRGLHPDHVSRFGRMQLIRPGQVLSLDVDIDSAAGVVRNTHRAACSRQSWVDRQLANLLSPHSQGKQQHTGNETDVASHSVSCVLLMTDLYSVVVRPRRDKAGSSAAAARVRKWPESLHG